VAKETAPARKPVNMTPWAEEAAEIESRTAHRPTGVSGEAGTPAEWTVVMAEAKDLAAARQVLDELRARTGFKNLILDRRAEKYVIARGRFADPRDPAAQACLKEVREVTIEGARPFETAQLSPPPSRYAEGTIPEYNLANVRRIPGNEAKVYTLQVGVYGRTDSQAPSTQEIADIRKFAEEAVAQLRKDGDEAYYMHGPAKSMVTIGAYSPREYDERHPKINDCPALKAAREKFPYNLVNGQGLKRRGRIDESFVTEIPR
jgi:hypothetical protein